MNSQPRMADGRNNETTKARFCSCVKDIADSLLGSPLPRLMLPSPSCQDSWVFTSQNFPGPDRSHFQWKYRTGRSSSLWDGPLPMTEASSGKSVFQAAIALWHYIWFQSFLHGTTYGQAGARQHLKLHLLITYPFLLLYPASFTSL